MFPWAKVKKMKEISNGFSSLLHSKRFLYQKLSGNCYNDSVNESRIFFKKTPSAKQNMLNDIIVRWIKAKIINIKWNEIIMENPVQTKSKKELSLKFYSGFISSFCKTYVKKKNCDWRLNWEDKRIVFWFLVPQFS